MNKTKTEKPPVTDIVEMMADADEQRAELAQTRETGLRLGFADLTPGELAAIDVDKLRALLDMKRSEEDRNAAKEFSAALVAFRADCPKIQKTSEIKGRSTYAGWDHVDAVITPILARHGLCLTFGAPTIKDGSVRILGRLRHSGGHSEEEPCEMPVDQRLSANDSQKAGSAISYAKRYLAGAMLNLAYTDDDDDGQAAGTELVTQDQADRLRELVDQLSDGARGRFFAWVGVNNCDEIPSAKFESAEIALGKAVKKESA